jgi:hypothetical protein
VHGDARAKKRGGQPPVVVVIGKDGRRAIARVDAAALGFQAHDLERQLHDAERQLRHEQRRLERRARAIEQLLEEERRRSEGGESFVPPGLQRKLEKKHKHKHKAVPPGRAHGWGHLVAPPQPPHAPTAPTPPRPPRATMPPRAPTPPSAPTPPGVMPVVFD